MMRRRHAAAAAAILGLACYGESSEVAAEESVTSGEGLFAAVDTAVNAAQTEPQEEGGSIAASGAALEEVSLSTGNLNTGGLSNTVFGACSGGKNAGTQFQEDCTLLVKGGTQDPGDTTLAMAALTPDQALAPRKMTVQQVEAGIGVAAMRMADLRLTSNLSGFTPNALMASNQLFGKASGGGASADVQFGQGGAFFNFKYLNANQSSDAYTFGYDLDGWRFTLGADYRLQENAVIGAFGSYSSGKVDYKRSKGDMDMSAWGVGLYGTQYWEGGGFIEGIIGYDFNDYDLTRRLNYSIETDGVLTQVRQNANSSPQSGVFYASLGGGYNIDTPSFTLTPALSFNYLKNEIDSYRERMSDPSAAGGSLAIAYDSQSYTSFNSRLGFMIAKALSTSSGVFVPQLSLDWIHEYSADQDHVSARFISDLSGTPLLITTSKPDHNYFDLGVGMSAQFAQGRSAFLSVNTLLGYEDVSSYTISGGIRIEF